ncbi:hypothetical protein [Streptomyces globisporus]|uniref:hypothetical protein n=1 Tax=Streptomyces globisporus TaxID=1908 RepID=UPI000691CACD|nr:hypothetical protein [Streptomyces globisporus]
MPEPTADERRRLIRRRTVRGAVGGGILGVVGPVVATAAYVPRELVELLRRFEWSWWPGGFAVVVCGVLGTWSGMRFGRVNGVREAALEPGETVLSAYAVRPPVVDGRPTRSTDTDRFELRVTDRGLQLWDGPDRLWSRPWSEVRLTAAGGGLLLVHHRDRTVAELLPVPGTIGWDALLLGAQRLRARSR